MHMNEHPAHPPKLYDIRAQIDMSTHKGTTVYALTLVPYVPLLLAIQPAGVA